VVDPVLVNHRAEAMFGPEVAAAYRDLLFPLADLVTPNVAEAKLLGMMGDDGRQTADDGRKIDDKRQTTDHSKKEPVVRGLSSAVFSSIVPPATQVLVKRARQTVSEIADAYWDGRDLTYLSQPFIDTINTHGSGDTLSAAICAFRAMGHDWPDSIYQAQAFTQAAIRRATSWKLGKGHGPVGLPGLLDK
jgi:hydroxymethylpyrimidine/phosphomethylpyrimidine kinase